MDKRQTARLTGWSLILMAIIAGFSLGYALPVFDKTDETSSLENLVNNQDLFQSMLIGILLILILDLIVSYTLYHYFKNDNKRISSISAILRIAYTLIFGIATFYLSKNLNFSDLSDQSASTNFELFQSIWSGGLIVFGFHILLIGILMKLHNYIPKILWYITLIAGVSYIGVHLLKFASPSLGFVNTLEMILALPMAIGELGLAIWLLVKGGKVST